MAINPNVISGPFTSDGITLAYPFTFNVDDATEVQVLANGVVLSSALYSVVLNADGTGTVMLNAAQPVSTIILLALNPNFQQVTQYVNQGAYSLSSINAALQRLSIKDNFLKSLFSRTAMTKIGVQAPSFGALVDGQALAYSSAGNELVTIPNTSAEVAADVAAAQALLTSTQALFNSSVAITPYHFGAVGWTPSNYVPGASTIGAPDDTAALQAFFNFIFSGVACKADLTGQFVISAPLTMGPAARYLFASLSIVGNLTLIAANGSAMVNMLTMNNMTSYPVQGKLTLIGTGGYLYSSRTVRNGLTFSGINTSTGWTGGIYCQYFQEWGVNASITDTNFLAYFNCPLLEAYGCGSGDISQSMTYALQSVWSTPVNVGTNNNQAQTTTINVATLPPAFLDATLATYPSSVLLNGKPYQIQSINRTNGKISISPWILSGDPVSGTLTYVFGGGLVETGANTNINNWSHVTTSVVGYGVLGASLFPSMLTRLTVQQTAIGYGHGIIGGVSTGGGASDFYSENDCVFDFVSYIDMSDRGALSQATFNSAHEYNKLKWACIMGNDGTNDRSQFGLYGINFPRDFGLWEKGTIDYVNAYAAINIGHGGALKRWSNQNAFTVYLQPFTTADWTLRGRDSTVLVIGGNGATGGPTGVTTVNAALFAGKTVNGAVSVAFPAYAKPIMILITADPVSGNFTAWQMN